MHLQLPALLRVKFESILSFVRVHSALSGYIKGDCARKACSCTVAIEVFTHYEYLTHEERDRYPRTEASSYLCTRLFCDRTARSTWHFSDWRFPLCRTVHVRIRGIVNFTFEHDAHQYSEEASPQCISDACKLGIAGYLHI